MAYGTARQEAATPGQTLPPDIETIRVSVRRLLVEGAEVPAGAELDILIAALREHMECLAPEVEQAAGKLDKDNIPGYCALACVGEARGKLRAKPTPRSGGGIAYARRLARSLNALCDHWENLAGTHSGAAR